MVLMMRTRSPEYFSGAMRILVQFLLLLSTVTSSPLLYLRGTRYGYARNIRPLSCVSTTGEKGVCMFVWNCMKANGTPIGTCLDRFYFGSCCKFENDIDIDHSSELTPESFTDAPVDVGDGIDNVDVEGTGQFDGEDETIPMEQTVFEVDTTSSMGQETDAGSDDKPNTDDTGGDETGTEEETEVNEVTDEDSVIEQIGDGDDDIENQTLVVDETGTAISNSQEGTEEVNVIISEQNFTNTDLINDGDDTTLPVDEQSSIDVEMQTDFNTSTTYLPEIIPTEDKIHIGDTSMEENVSGVETISESTIPEEEEIFEFVTDSVVDIDIYDETTMKPIEDTDIVPNEQTSDNPIDVIVFPTEESMEEVDLSPETDGSLNVNQTEKTTTSKVETSTASLSTGNVISTDDLFGNLNPISTSSIKPTGTSPATVAITSPSDEESQPDNVSIDTGIGDNQETSEETSTSASIDESLSSTETNIPIGGEDTDITSIPTEVQDSTTSSQTFGLSSTSSADPSDIDSSISSSSDRPIEISPATVIISSPSDENSTPIEVSISPGNIGITVSTQESGHGQNQNSTDESVDSGSLIPMTSSTDKPNETSTTMDISSLPGVIGVTAPTQASGQNQDQLTSTVSTDSGGSVLVSSSSDKPIGISPATVIISSPSSENTTSGGISIVPGIIGITVPTQESGLSHEQNSSDEDTDSESLIPTSTDESSSNEIEETTLAPIDDSLITPGEGTVSVVNFENETTNELDSEFISTMPPLVEYETDDYNMSVTTSGPGPSVINPILPIIDKVPPTNALQNGSTSLITILPATATLSPTQSEVSTSSSTESTTTSTTESVESSSAGGGLTTVSSVNFTTTESATSSTSESVESSSSSGGLTTTSSTNIITSESTTEVTTSSLGPLTTSTVSGGVPIVFPSEEVTTTTLAPSNGTTVSSEHQEFLNKLKTANYSDICGLPLVPTQRIVGGSEARFAEWPWQVSLRQWRTITFLHKCGAALVNENWAITAAHCVENVEPHKLLLRLGEFDLERSDEPYPFQERKVELVAAHPQFDSRTFEYDLALLRFTEPVLFQPNIVPICIPNSDYNFINDTGYVTGWGRLYEDGPLPSVMQNVPVPVITNGDCQDMYRAAGYVEHIPNIFICAGYEEGKRDSCEGDSGGPMVIQHEGRWKLAGIISWGIGCALPNQPGVYTRISEFRTWINTIIQF